MYNPVSSPHPVTLGSTEFHHFIFLERICPSNILHRKRVSNFEASQQYVYVLNKRDEEKAAEFLSGMLTDSTRGSGQELKHEILFEHKM